MKNSMLALIVGLVLGTSGAALAATLSNANGQTCDGTGSWHFVNNQIGSATSGSITAVFSCGTFTSAQSKVTPGTIHFQIGTSGDCTLLSGSTNLPGRLVLSDFTCTPEKCEPTKEVCDGIDNDCNGKVDDGITCK